MDLFLIVRAICSVAVVWTHIFPGPIFSFQSVNYGMYVFPSAIAAVHIFFLLSGYSIGYGFFSGAYSLSKKSLIKFYLNRILRIVPLYYCVILVARYIVYPTVPIPGEIFLRFFAFIANDPIVLPYLQPLSIISTEMQFYLVAPLLFFIIKRFRNKIPLVLLFFSAFYIGFLLRFSLFYLGIGTTNPSYITHIYTTLWGNADIFISGMLFALIVVEKKLSLIRVLRRLSIVVLPLFFVWYIWSNYSTYNLHEYTKYQEVMMQIIFLLPPATSIVIGYLFILLGTSQKKHQQITVRKFFSLWKNPLQYPFILGILSYGIYLWHSPILSVYMRKFPLSFSPEQVMMRFIGVLGISIFLSFVTYLLIERVFLLFKRR